MRIALEAMGGDLGARPAVEGAIEAVRRYGVNVALVGRRRDLNRLLKPIFDKAGGRDPRIEVVDAEDVVRMDDNPRDSLRKKNSSLAIATNLVKTGEADALVSAGNTGAVMANALFSWRTLPNVKKPAIATMLPTMKDRVVIIDSGANVDCKPRQLVNFAVMGSVYARHILGRGEPRVGLLSIGEEATKGNELTLGTHKMIGGTDLNFVGNAEGRDIFTGEFDVIVCDGFVGNVVLKVSEGLAATVFRLIKGEAQRSLTTQIGGLLMMPAAARVKKRTDYDESGGAPLLGVNGVCIICHGSSNAKAFMNAMRVANECHQKNLLHHLGEELTRTGELVAASGLGDASEAAG